MFQDPLNALSHLAPLPDHVFGQAVVAEFDDGVLATMIEQGLIISAMPATHITCAACDAGECVPWEPIENAAGSLIGISYVCETIGTEHIGPETWIRQYRINFAGLARLIGEGLGSRQVAEEIEPGWSCRWARLKIGTVMLMVAVARGLNAHDAEPRWKTLGLTPQAVVLNVGPTPRPPASLDPKKAGAYHLTVWSFLDVDDTGRVIVDRECLDEAIGDLRSDRPIPRKPTPIILRQQGQVKELAKEIRERLRSARRALLDGNGGAANRMCTELRSPEAVAKIIGVNRSTIHRWREKAILGMDALDYLLSLADNLDELRSWGE